MSYSQLGNLFSVKQAIDSIKSDKEMEYIEHDDEVVKLLYSMFNNKDPHLTETALNKLQKNKNLEQELINILNDDQLDYRSMIAYLENNQVAHPELFIAPLNKSIFRISEDLEFRLNKNNYRYEYEYVETLNVDGLCRILNGQFKPFKNDFRLNMLKIQSELEKETTSDYIEICNKYKTAVKNWLDTN